MRLRLLLVVFLVGTSFSGSSQLFPEYYDTLPKGQAISVTGSLDYAGSAVQKELTSKFIRGGVITDDIKNNSLARHRVVNRIGFDAHGELKYENFDARIFKEKPCGFVVKAGTYYFGGALYSKDLYQFAMYGNAGFDGDTADFSGTDLSFMAFQKVGFGLVSQKNRSSLSINVYNIQRRISGDFRDFQVLLSEGIDTVRLVADGEFELSTGANFNQGVGFGIDFDYYMPFEWKSGRTAFVHFSLHNLGFAHLYEPQKQYKSDNEFIFSGLRFNEIIGEDAIINDSLNVLDTLGISSSSITKTTLLPGYIQIAKIVDNMQEQPFQSYFGLRLYPTLIYSPYVFVGVNYRPIKSLNIGASVSYGGFAGFRGGFYTSGNFGKLRATIGTENLIGLVSKKGSGESAFIQLSCAF